jgi:LysM repeat protein
MRTWKLLVITVVAAALSVPAAASASFMHVVAPGESLASVAAADGLSVDQLAAANGVSPDSQLIAGSSLAIPPQTGATGSPTTYSAAPSSTTYASTTQPASSAGGYVVQPGDTLWSIASRSGVSVDQLAAANGLSPDGLLLSGSTLSVSGGQSSEEAGETSSSDATSSGTTQFVSTSPAGQASTAGGSSGAQPTAEFLSPSEVGSIAASEGVPPSLAEAIGYQESGFNNNEVSTTGAVGVMQIEPGTWNYIGQNLAGPPPLQSASASDNVRAGTLLLHSLLNQTGGDAAMAAAAYYQGLPSIQAHGILPSTQTYVNDVMSLQQRFGGG